MKDGQTFSAASGACIETDSGALVTIAVAGPKRESSEGTIIGVAYQGQNFVTRVSSNKVIDVLELHDLKSLPEDILTEVQKIIDDYSNNLI